MKLDRFRAPALAATAVLLVSGAASAFAASPAAVAPVAAAPVAQAEPAATGTDTDTLKAGDQTTPDAAATAGSAAEPAAGPATVKVAEKSSAETAAEAKGTGTAGVESDGPGGHADADGQNVDHQFDGEE